MSVSVVEKRIMNKVNDSVLMEFLGADNIERLKKAVTDAIIHQIINDLDDCGEYLISPDDITNDLIDDIVDHAKDTIRPKVEKKLYEKTMVKLGLED